MTRRGSSALLIEDDSLEYNVEYNDEGSGNFGTISQPENERILHKRSENSAKIPTNLTVSDSDDSGIHIKKQIGLWDGVGIIVGIMIGSGIFISPKGVIQYTGSVGMSLVVWTVSGILSTVGALCYAELGTMIPKSGGEYAYISEAFGSLPGFLCLWVALVVILPTGNTVIALTFSYYILKPLFNDCQNPPEEAVRLVAALILCFLTWINCTNVKAVMKIQDTFTCAKIFALVVIIVTGMYHLATGHTENYQEPFKNTVWSAGHISTGFYQGLFSFAGWNCLNYVVEELKDPYKNLPRAIMISLPIVTSIYFLVNVAYFAVLTPDQIVASNAVAVTFGNAMLGPMAWIIPVFVACSTFCCLNGVIFASSRLYFVGAREGQLPDALALINKDAFTPVPALIFLGVLTMLFLISSDVQMLINYTSFAESLFVLIAIAGLLWMRYKHPEIDRPVKIWIGLPIVFFFVALFLVVFPLIANPVQLGYAVLIIVTGFPVYYLTVARKSILSRTEGMRREFTAVVQLLTNGLPEE